MPPLTDTSQGEETAPAQASPPFRQEALQHYQSFRTHGNVIRIAPRWSRWSYGFLVWAVVASLLYAALGTVHEYASGPVVVRIDGRHAITAHSHGTVAAVLVHPGVRVRRGDELVRFHLAEEEAQLDRANKEHRALLLRVLRDPGDQAARNELGALEAQRDMAQARLTERSMYAPEDGVVSDVRARPGQAVDAGDPLVTLTGPAARGRAVIVVSSHYRPLLRAGMRVRLELVGFPFAYQELRVDAVGDEAVGPREVKRYLGPDSADTITVDGPVVLVEATLPSVQFAAGGERFQYYDGMVGKADVRVRTESILVALVPGFRELSRRTP
jgi:membrane fusion protein (multidrug efflux system)